LVWGVFPPPPPALRGLFFWAQKTPPFGAPNQTCSPPPIGLGGGFICSCELRVLTLPLCHRGDPVTPLLPSFCFILLTTTKRSLAKMGAPWAFDAYHLRLNPQTPYFSSLDKQTDAKRSGFLDSATRYAVVRIDTEHAYLFPRTPIHVVSAIAVFRSHVSSWPSGDSLDQ